MDDSIISRTGNSKILMGPANFAEMFPTWEAFRDAFAASGVPTDILTNPSGYEKLGAPLNAATLLKNTTAALVGLDGSAVPDDMLYAIILKIQYNVTNLVKFTVVDDWGAVMPGVKISGLTAYDGSALVTDENGVATASISANTSVTFTPPVDYLDRPPHKQTIEFHADIFYDAVTVTLPCLTDGQVRMITASTTLSCLKDHEVKLCVCQGGQGGGGGFSDGASGGGGGSGKIYNHEPTISLTAGETHEIVIGAGGVGGTYADVPNTGGGESMFDDISSSPGIGGHGNYPFPFEDSSITYAGGVGGSGGSGGAGGNLEEAGLPGSAGGKGMRAGGEGGRGGLGGSGGSIQSNHTSGYNGGAGSRGYNGGPAAGGGGGGGGGFGGTGYSGSSNGLRGRGGNGGNGGNGAVLIKFLT